jgi:hypothetical protein
LHGAFGIWQRRPEGRRDDGSTFLWQIERETSVSVCECDFQGIDFRTFR